MQQALDDFYTRVLAMDKNRDVVWQDSDNSVRRRAHAFGEFFLLNFVCKGGWETMGHCLDFHARLETEGTEQMTPSDVPLGAWSLTKVGCANLMNQLSQCEPCCVMDAYERHVSPWTIAGRLAPPIKSGPQFGPLTVPRRIDSHCCFLCNSSNDATVHKRYLPDGVYCCDRVHCVSTIWSFVHGAHLYWCLIGQTDLCADVARSIAYFVARLVAKER